MILLFEADRLIYDSSGRVELDKTDGRIFSVLQLMLSFVTHIASSYLIRVDGVEYEVSPWITFKYLLREKVKIACVTGFSWRDIKVKIFSGGQILFFDKGDGVYDMILNGFVIGEVAESFSFLKSRIKVELDDNSSDVLIAAIVSTVLQIAFSLP